MSPPASGAGTRIFLLLQDQEQNRFLAEPLSESWHLPYIDIDGDDFELNEIAPAIESKYRLNARVLSLLSETTQEAAPERNVVFEIDNVASDRAVPPSWQWIGIDRELMGLSDGALAAIRSRMLTRNPPHYRSWMKSGFHVKAEGWIDANIKALGMSRTGRIEEFRSWEISCLLRTPTDQGMLYFKTSGGSPLFVNEAQVTQELSTRFPKVVPRPLAIEPHEQWMLLADFGETVGFQASMEKREAVFRAFGALQRESAEHCLDLIKVGCMDRRMDFLSRQIESLSGDAQLLNALTVADRDDFQGRLSEFKTSCDRLAEGTIPDTLVHGDLSMNNVAGPDGAGSFVFFDWTDASVTHPFMDMMAFFRIRDPAMLAQMREAYLATWTERETLDRIHETWNLALPLCALNQAVSYRAIASQCDAARAAENIKTAAEWIGRALRINEAMQAPA